jgi:hypothetical protein
VKYSFSILVVRQIVALAVAALTTVLAKWLDPESAQIVTDHVWEIVVLIALTVFGVDITAYHQSKAEKSS